MDAQGTGRLAKGKHDFEGGPRLPGGWFGALRRRKLAGALPRNTKLPADIGVSHPRGAQSNYIFVSGSHIVLRLNHYGEIESVIEKTWCSRKVGVILPLPV
jgi:hypothetical protein